MTSTHPDRATGGARRWTAVYWALSAGPEVLRLMALAEAEVLGHCHCFVEVAGQGIRCMRIACERDRTAAFLAPPLRDPWPQRATDVQLQRPAAASKVAHHQPEHILKDPWVERTFLLSRPIAHRVIDVRQHFVHVRAGDHSPGLCQILPDHPFRRPLPI